MAGFENVPLWHERDISHSSAERVVLTDSTTLAHYLLDRFAWVMEGLEVYPERMRRNIDAAHGLTFSGAVCSRWSRAVGARGRICHRAAEHPARVDEELPLRDLLEADPRRRRSWMPLRSTVLRTGRRARNASVAFDRLEAAHV